MRILTDTKASRRIWDMSQISARDKRCKGEFNTLCTKSVLRAESPSKRILSVHDTLEYTSIDYMDHPIWSSSQTFSNVECVLKRCTGFHRNCRNAIQKYRRDPRWWFHDQKIPQSSSYSLSSNRSYLLRQRKTIASNEKWFDHTTLHLIKMTSSWSSVLETNTEYYHEYMKPIQC